MHHLMGITFWKFIKKSCLDLHAPPLCAYCKIFLQERVIFCDRCLVLIKPITSSSLEINTTYTMKVFAASDYKDPIKSLILAKSSSNIVASKHLGNLIWDLTHVASLDFDYIIPVPLHWTRFAKRGFNQAEEMAKVLAEKSGKPMALVLQRAKRTPFQSKVLVQERIGNVADAFALKTLDRGLYAGKHLLIVDDLSTTGSTLKFAARELARLKPASITAVVAARVV